jgi:hypothetical protein
LTIYWERCDVCGRYLPTRQCTLHPELNVCIYCCLSCPERSRCPKPAWELKIVKLAKPSLSLEEKKKIMGELFSKLESGK